MVLTKKIISFCEQYYYKNQTQKWDQNGWQIKTNIAKQTKNVAVALDLTIQVAEWAIKNQINLIITHHPFLFHQTLKSKNLTLNQKKIIKLCERYNVGVYSIHSNYDGSYFGMNYHLLQKLGLRFIHSVRLQSIAKVGVIPSSATPSLLAFLTKVAEIFPKRVKVTTNVPLGTPIKKVVLCSGSGNGIFANLPEQPDVFITGECKWSEIVMISQTSCALVLLDHFMENWFIRDVTAVLQANFKEQLVVMPFLDANPLQSFHIKPSQ